jgi:hypothetical protein
VVCLLFSSAYAPALTSQGLRDLRRILPSRVELWAGGHGVKSVRKPIEGECLTPAFADFYACLARWKADSGFNFQGLR